MGLLASWNPEPINAVKSASMLPACRQQTYHFEGFKHLIVLDSQILTYITTILKHKYRIVGSFVPLRYPEATSWSQVTNTNGTLQDEMNSKTV